MRGHISENLSKSPTFTTSDKMYHDSPRRQIVAIRGHSWQILPTQHKILHHHEYDTTAHDTATMQTRHPTIKLRYRFDLTRKCYERRRIVTMRSRTTTTVIRLRHDLHDSATNLPRQCYELAMTPTRLRHEYATTAHDTATKQTRCLTIESRCRYDLTRYRYD